MIAWSYSRRLSAAAMIGVVSVGFLGAADTVATSQEASTDVQSLVRAARDDAVGRLLGQIESEPIAPDLTARQLIDALGPLARSALRESLENAPQLGGPRYAAPGAAQVQLQAAGDVVAGQILTLVNSHLDAGGTLPQGLNQEKLSALLGNWSQRTFVATGRSVSSQLADSALPADAAADPDTVPLELSGDPNIDKGAFTHGLWKEWAGVNDEGRLRAIADARRDVVETLMLAARPVVLIDGVPAAENVPETPPVTLGDAFDSGTLGEKSRRWLAGQPVTRIHFDSERRLEMRVSVDSAAWVEHIRETIQNSEVDAGGNAGGNAGLPAVPERRWAEVVGELRKVLPRDPEGHAVADVAAVREGEVEESPLRDALAPLTDPNDAAAVAPQWSTRPLLAEGTVTAPKLVDASPWEESRSRLVTARQAESAARTRLLEAIRALPLGERLTLGEVADSDPQAAAVIEATVRAAEVFSSDYADDGTVRVIIATRGPSLWKSLLLTANIQ